MKMDKFRVSTMAHFMLNQYVLYFDRAPEDPRYPSSPEQPNGFIAGGRWNYYRIRKAGKNGSVTAAIVYRDPNIERYVFIGHVYIKEDGKAMDGPYLTPEIVREIQNRAVAEYLKLPGVTIMNMNRSFTRVQSTLTAASYQRVPHP